MAVDGSTLRAPLNQETRRFFGVWHAPKGKRTCPPARISLLYDVLNHLTVHALMSPKNEDERSSAAQHLETSGPDDLLLPDRGYTGSAFFARVLDRNSHFLVRIKRNQTVVRKFLGSEKRERFIVKKRYRMVLLTSLIDRKRFPLSRLFLLSVLCLFCLSANVTLEANEVQLPLNGRAGCRSFGLLPDTNRYNIWVRHEGASCRRVQVGWCHILHSG